MKNRSGFGWIGFISGLCMLLLGVFTFIRPESMFTWFTVIYGLIAVITGVCDIVFYIKAERYTGFGPVISLIFGVLGVNRKMDSVHRVPAMVYSPLYFTHDTSESDSVNRRKCLLLHLVGGKHTGSDSRCCDAV